MREGPSPDEIYKLTQPNVVIGREVSSEIDINIPSPTISRKHARIFKRDEQWLIQDLGSSNGTFLNGHRLAQEPTQLKNGDQIRLGSSVTFIFQRLD